MVKAIFLDIDGVINICTNGPSIDGDPNWKFSPFIPEKVEMVNELRRRTGAVIVISSSWKRGNGAENLRRALTERGLNYDDVTPDLLGEVGGKFRGHEIAFWIYMHWPIESFVMIDDGRHTSGLPWIEERLVQTESEKGLLTEHVERATGLLNGGA